MATPSAGGRVLARIPSLQLPGRRRRVRLRCEWMAPLASWAARGATDALRWAPALTEIGRADARGRDPARPGSGGDVGSGLGRTSPSQTRETVETGMSQVRRAAITQPTTGPTLPGGEKAGPLTSSIHPGFPGLKPRELRARRGGGTDSEPYLSAGFPEPCPAAGAAWRAGL